MSRRTNRSWTGGPRHWAAPFVLAILCLRALVPAGFMLAPIDGRLAVVLCDSDAPGAMQHRTGHDHAGHDHASHHHTQTDPTCPYAQSAGPAPLPAPPVLAAAPLETVPVLPTHFAQTHAQFGPSRQQSPRGPPHLA
jgi:hypothetical protein